MVLRLSKNLSKYAVQILIVASLLTVSLLAYLFDFEERSFRLEVDPSIKNLVPENGRELEIYRHTQNIFENDDYLLVVWLGEDFFIEKNLAALKQTTRAIESLPGVTQVDSLATAMSIRSEPDLTNIDPFLHSIPQGREQLLEAKETALGNKIFNGQLISQDGKGTILSVHFDQELTTFELMLLITEIEDISEYGSGGLDHFLTGPLYMRTETGRLLMRDLYRVLPMAVLVTFFVAAIGFRNFTGPLLPAFSNILALSITLGVFVLMGNQFNVFYLEDWIFESSYAEQKLTDHFNTLGLKGFGIQEMKAGVVAAGAILHYLSEAHHNKIPHITSIRRIFEEEYVWMDRFTIRNLELFQSTNPNGVSLIDVLDKTLTAMGGRMLKHWLAFPERNLSKIEARLDVVAVSYTHLTLPTKRIV